MALITLSSGKDFQSLDELSILESATQAQINLPYSCKTGRCSTCKCKVINGETKALVAEIGLTESEKAEGWILSCARSALTDLSLDLEDLGGAALPKAKTLPCRINSIDKLAPDVVRVMLRLPPTADFSFIPGQYVDVIGLGGIRRSYSLANASFIDKQLELHIRAVDGGAMSRYWFDQAKVNDLLRLYGPLGTFFLRDVTSRDLVFLATGTGIAPVKAMLESMHNIASNHAPRSVTVLWGGRTSQDLYLDVQSISGDFSFIPVLSRADESWSGVRGYVQQALLSILPDLGQASVYACGSDAMIRNARVSLTATGLPINHFYSDSFVCSASF